GVIANVKAVGHLLGIKALQSLAATYTGNMRSAFKAAGFTVLTGSKYLNSAAYLLPGDILLNDSHHTATNITRGKSAGNEGAGGGMSSKSYLSKGDTGSGVKAMQTLLIAAGYSCGTAGADGDFGSATDAALRKFQKANGLEVDGKYGPVSKAKLTALTSKKSVEEIAKEVIAGKWGNGVERTSKLWAAGYDAAAVQKKVNELLK
ncbi:MAG: peptidoglycan-binding protein, partial [Eubacteriales bacterium]|nr:peptidoglycan-binding protein [Eubacteriales bacterium]